MDKNKEMTYILQELLEIQKLENMQDEVAEPIITMSAIYSLLCC